MFKAGESVGFWFKGRFLMSGGITDGRGLRRAKPLGLRIIIWKGKENQSEIPIFQ